tara:strand:+ start:14590 stop:14835 length:246 start_codon:yes stop_codon:yes gene_type:complete
MEEKKQVNITVPAEAKPSFSNATQITVNNDSVTLQFAYVRPNTEQGQLMSEIVLTPKHAIDFQNALDATLKKHFTKHLDNE